MKLTLPCEYCGAPVAGWDTRLAVPACCPRCGWIPLVLAVLWFLVALGLLVPIVGLWRSL